MPTKEQKACQRAALYLSLIFLGMCLIGLLPQESTWEQCLCDLLLSLFMLLPLLFFRQFGISLLSFPKNAWLALPLFFLLPFLSLSFAGLFGLFVPQAPAPSLPLWQALLFSALLPALVEELLFRHLLLFSFRSENGKYGGSILLSALLFSLLHANFYQMPYVFVAGLLLGAAALIGGSVLLPFVLHLWNNLLSLLLVPLVDFWVLFALLGILSLLSLSLFFLLLRKKTLSFPSVLQEAVKDKKGRKTLLATALRSPLWLCLALSLLLAVARLL